MCALYIGDQSEGNSSQFHCELGGGGGPNPIFKWTIGRHTYHPWLYTKSPPFVLCSFIIPLKAGTRSKQGRQMLSFHFWKRMSIFSWWLIPFALSCPSSRWIYQDKNAVHIYYISLFSTRYLLEFRNAPCGTRILLCFSRWIHGTVCLVLVQELVLHSRIHLRANKFFYKMHRWHRCKQVLLQNPQ
jgi:hypothetical protein